MFKYTLSITIEIDIVHIHRCLLGVDLSHMCILVCSGKCIALAKVGALIQGGGEKSSYLVEKMAMGVVTPAFCK
jgi:hypothetical protein